MESLCENCIIYASLIFIFIKIVIPMTKYVISSIFFIRPMTKKYKIMASDLSNDIKNRYVYILFAIILTGFYFKIIYITSIIFFETILIIYVAISIYNFYQYKKYDILEYINYFSADLFDWDKIYTLNIPEDIKKCCFAIHNIDYETYGETYLSHLKVKQCSLQYDIDKQIKRNGQSLNRK